MFFSVFWSSFFTRKKALMSEDYQIGLQYYRNKEYEKAFKYYQLAANQGDAAVQNMLGYMYHEGNGVEKSYEKSVKYFQLAADQGLDTAQDNLGHMYKTGKGVEKSYEKAVKYFQLAADQGCIEAQFNLGHMYENGEGVEQSYEKAVEYFQLAAEQGNKTAQKALKNLLSSKEYIEYALLEQLKINKSLNKCVQKLKGEIEDLKLQIKYMPNGAGYQEAKEDFEELASTT